VCIIFKQTKLAKLGRLFQREPNNNILLHCNFLACNQTLVRENQLPMGFDCQMQDRVAIAVLRIAVRVVLDQCSSNVQIGHLSPLQW